MLLKYSALKCLLCTGLYFLYISRQSPERESGDKSTVNNMSNVAEGGTSSGWGWGAWGTVFNQATASVTSSLSHVIEKVESTLGIPEPGELEEVVPKDEKEVIITEPRSIQIERAEKDSVEGSSKDSGKQDHGNNYSIKLINSFLVG